MSEQEADLSRWMEAEQWRAQHAFGVFPTPASWSWFKRCHRRELVEANVLVLGGGRAPDTVLVGRIDAKVQDIRRKQSLARLDAIAA